MPHLMRVDLCSESLSDTLSGMMELLPVMRKRRDSLPSPSPILLLAELTTCLDSMLMIRTMIMSSTPSSKRADCVTDPVTASGSCRAIVPVRVLISE